MNTQRTEADAVAALIQKPFVETIHGVPHLLTPNGEGSWTYHNLEYLLDKPTRKQGSITVHEVESFIAMAKKHGSLANATVYIDVDYSKNKFTATAVYNDHAEGVAGYRDHRTVFSPRQTEEWNRWTSNNKKQLSQVQLAHFLEENIGDIAGGDKMPSGSDVLTFVSNLEEVRTVKFGSGINLQNGMVALELVEDGDKATKGKLELFREFAIGVAPFFGGSHYGIKAFLRYRIDRNTGEITFWYELQRPDKVLEDASKELIAKINTESGLPVIYGTP
jgi:uncharacterized protein YfdQ (DUF2303 family)